MSTRATRDDVIINLPSVTIPEDQVPVYVQPPVSTDDRSSSSNIRYGVTSPGHQAKYDLYTPVLTDGRSSSSQCTQMISSSVNQNCHDTPHYSQDSYVGKFPRKQAKVILADNTCNVETPDNDFSVNPGNSDERSSSFCIGTLGSSTVNDNKIGVTKNSPNGAHSVRLIDGKSLLSNILSFCKPVTVSNDVILRIKNMILAKWPRPTEETRQALPMFAHLYDQVKAYNLPNCLGAKIPIHSGLNVERWVILLQNYHDNELCHFLAYGWPLGFYADDIPQTVPKNHPSAIEFPQHIQEFLSTELSFKAIEGPTQAAPFEPWSRISPLMTRPKKGTDQRRVIVDLSYPEGAAVNTGIDNADYLGNDISYTLPTIGDLIAKLQVEGQGAFIWKADLARAYRQLRADPVDAPLLCIQFNGSVYIDRCPPFGCRSSSAACQRVANALVFLMAERNHHCLAYLDDFAGCSNRLQQAQHAFDTFKHLTAHLGLQLSLHKCLQPATQVEWLGYFIDTQKMSISITDHKLREVVEECGSWFNKKRATKTMVQSLVGKLSHIANCVIPGRKFLARMLGTLRAFEGKKWTTVDLEFIKDVRWFYHYAASSNGITLYSPSLPTVIIECDASLEGAGGNTNELCYTWRYTTNYKQRFPVIHQMEAINILVAYRTLAHPSNKGPIRALILTDNMSSSQALMSGRTKDLVLASCAREFWLEAAKNGDTIEIEHRPGTAIPLADALSRMALDNTKSDYVHAIVSQNNMSFVQPVLNNYVFFDPSI